MQRREFIRKTGLGLAAVAGAGAVSASAEEAPAALPTLKWRLA